MKYYLVLIPLVACVSWFVAPEYMKDKAYSLIDQDNVERQCFNYFKDKLKDPETAYLIKTGVKQYEQDFQIRVRAKNSYGAYDHVRLSCHAKNGKLDRPTMLKNEVSKVLSSI